MFATRYCEFCVAPHRIVVETGACFAQSPPHPADRSCANAAPHFGELLRHYRRAAGLTQEELAEEAGVSPRSISGWESGGVHLPRRDTLAMLVRALGLEGAERGTLQASIERPGPTPPRPARAARTQSATDAQQLRWPRARAPGAPAAPHHRAAADAGRHRRRRQNAACPRAGPRAVDSFPDGVWLVELAGVVDGSVLPAAVATAVGMREADARNVIGSLDRASARQATAAGTRQLRAPGRRVCPIGAHLLRSCPRLQIVATSRESLAVEGEIAWRVPPLDLPDLADVDRLTPRSCCAVPRYACSSSACTPSISRSS